MTSPFSPVDPAEEQGPFCEISPAAREGELAALSERIRGLSGLCEKCRPIVAARVAADVAAREDTPTAAIKMAVHLAEMMIGMGEAILDTIPGISDAQPELPFTGGRVVTMPASGRSVDIASAYPATPESWTRPGDLFKCNCAAASDPAKPHARSCPKAQ